MLRALVVLVVLLAVPATAGAQQPTVYSSLPLQAAYGKQARDVVRGIRLALDDAGRPVKYVSLDDSSRRVRSWVPEKAAASARRAAQDDSTVAYIGEFNSGASAVSIPILNEAEILQVSPSTTALGLTVDGIGAERGEPDKYYPTGERTYGRVIPNDRVQAAAAGVAIRDAGVKRLLVVHDGEVYGYGMARLAAAAARDRGVDVLAVRRLTLHNARAIASIARRRHVDGVYFGGVGSAEPPVDLWRAFRRQRRVRFFGPDGIALPDFLRRIGARLAKRTRVTVLPMAPDAYPQSGQDVLRRLGPGTDVYALYGYEAMSAVLDALKRGGPTRQGVRGAFFSIKDRDSVLGRYSIDPNGDTSLTQYGLYRGGARGTLVWERPVDAAAR